MNNLISIRYPIACLLTLAIATIAHAETTPETVKVRNSVAKLDSLIESTLQRTGVPGLAVAVVYRDEVVMLKGYGVRKLGQPEKVDTQTVFQLASVSKPIASTVVAAIIDRGSVNWDDTIVEHLPEFVMNDPWVARHVTLRDMLCHRSGLPDHAGDLLEDLGYDRAQVFHRLRYLPAATPFRTKEVYTNFGYTAAGIAASNSAKKTWESASDEFLYVPLKMTSTSSRYADYVAAKNRAVLHARIGDKWVAKAERMPDAQSPAGGVSSNVRDMSQWMRLQLGNGKYDGKQVISAKSLGETHVPQIMTHGPADPSVDRAGFYCLGWNLNYDEQGRVRLNHSGAFATGASTVVSMVPAEELGIIVLTNGAPTGVPESLAAIFLDDVIYGKPQRDWAALYEKAMAEISLPEYGRNQDYLTPPKYLSSRLAEKAYVGTYKNDYFGPLEVRVSPAGFELLLGPQKRPYAMRHWDRDVFIYQPIGENAGGLSSIVFTIGADGNGTSVTIENLNVEGMGTFQRVKQPD